MQEDHLLDHFKCEIKVDFLELWKVGVDVGNHSAVFPLKRRRGAAPLFFL